eukprot:5843375-Prorocentrum_lima.AAC.1
MTAPPQYRPDMCALYVRHFISEVHDVTHAHHETHPPSYLSVLGWQGAGACRLFPLQHSPPPSLPTGGWEGRRGEPPTPDAWRPNERQAPVGTAARLACPARQ